MNIEDSWRTDVWYRAREKGITEEQAGRELQAEFEARCAAEDAARTPEERAARAAEQARNRQVLADGAKAICDLMQRRYGRYADK